METDSWGILHIETKVSWGRLCGVEGEAAASKVFGFVALNHP